MSFLNPFIGEVKVVGQTSENQNLFEQSKSEISRDTHDKLNSLAGVQTRESAKMQFDPA